MDFNDLKERYPARARRFDEMAKSLKLAEVALNLQKNPVVEGVMLYLHLEIDAIENSLLTMAKMTAEERRILFVQRECWRWFIQTFEGHAEIAKNILKKIDRLWQSKNTNKR